MITRVPGNELPVNEATDIGHSSDDSSLDPVDVLRGLAHLDVLRERADRYAASRLVRFASPAQNAAAAHLRDYGHALSFGCCGPYRPTAV